jgi:uncharacterized protein with PQ loop repeat
VLSQLTLPLRFLLYLAYYPPDQRKSSEWRLSLFVFCIVVGFLLGSLLVYALLFSIYEYHEPPVRIFAYLLSCLACTVVLFQFFPQIYKTWTTKNIGSLSILAMCIQSPGALLIVRSQIMQPNSDYTSWLPTFAAAVFQSILLFLCLYLKFFYKGQHPIEEISSASDTKKSIRPPNSLSIEKNGRIESQSMPRSNSDSQFTDTSSLLASTDHSDASEVKPLSKY